MFRSVSPAPHLPSWVSATPSFQLLRLKTPKSSSNPPSHAPHSLHQPILGTRFEVWLLLPTVTHSLAQSRHHFLAYRTGSCPLPLSTLAPREAEALLVVLSTPSQETPLLSSATPQLPVKPPGLFTAHRLPRSALLIHLPSPPHGTHSSCSPDCQMFLPRSLPWNALPWHPHGWHTHFLQVWAPRSSYQRRLPWTWVRK